MADTKITDFTSATAAGANEFYINDAGADKKLSLTQIKDFIGAGSLGLIEATARGFNLP